MSFVRKSASTLATQALLIVLGVANGILVARVLGPTLKGQSALLTLVTQTLFMVFSFGLGASFSFFTAKKRFSVPEIVSCATACALVLGGAGVVVFYVTWPFHGPLWSGIPHGLVFAAALISVPQIYSTYLSRILVGQGSIYTVNLGDLARGAGSLLGVLVLVVFMSQQLGGYLWSTLLGAATQGAVLAWALRAHLRPARFWRTGLVQGAVGYGIKSHLLLLTMFLNYRVDMLLLQYFTDATTVGFYSLAVGMAELMWLVPNATVAPLFSDVARSDAPNRSVVTLRTWRWTFLVLVVAAVAGAIMGRPLILLLYGPAYLPAYEPFLWILPGVCVLPLGKLLGVDLAARGAPGYGTIASVAALAANFLANLWLIPLWGGVGAALASTLSYALMASISLLFFSRATGHGLKELVAPTPEERQLARRTLAAMGLARD